jgi:hypothetical protein
MRLIAVPKSTIDVLKSWKAAQNGQRLKAGENRYSKNEDGEDVNWVFTTRLGKPMHPDSISSWFPEFASKIMLHTPCGQFIQKEDYCQHCDRQVPPNEIYRLPRLNFHGTRHTSATLPGSVLRAVQEAWSLGGVPSVSDLTMRTPMLDANHCRATAAVDP